MNRKKFREGSIKFMDNAFTALAMIILIICLLVCLPFLILDKWLLGERNNES